MRPTLWDPLGACGAGRRWLWAGLALMVGLSQGGAFVHSLFPPRDVVMDFFQDWSAARNAFSGLPVYLDQGTLIVHYLGRVDPDTILIKVNAHPPTSVLLAFPFALMDYFDAVLAWNLVSLVALLASLWLVARQLNMPLSPWSALPALTLLLLCSPLRQQFYQGQFNLILLLLLVGTWAADRSDNALAAGVCLGAATAVKLFPGFLFLYFALRGRWRVVISGLLTLAGLTALTAMALGVDAYTSYAVTVLPELDRFRGWWNNVSLTGFCYRLFNPSVETRGIAWRAEALWSSPALARAGGLLLSAILVAPLVPVVRRARTRTELDLTFGLFLIAMLLVSPITWDHYFLLLLVPLAVTWAELPATPGARLLFLLTLVGLWIHPTLLGRMLISQSTGAVASPLQSVGVLSVPTYALLTLFALGLIEMRHARRASPRTAPLLAAADHA